MCGFAGFYFLGSDKKKEEDNLRSLNSMSLSIQKRGPDGHGQWHDPVKGIYLDHRRLSIIDISKRSNQPMTSHSNRWKIVFNGEIYNFLELKKKISEEKNLELKFWKTSGDTEVLINLIDFYGIDETLKLVEGMFAFALWDNLKNELIIARDRLGEKPLYYCNKNETFVFASDILAIKEYYKEEKLFLDINSVRELSKYSYIPSPNTIYKDVKKIESGSYITIKSNVKNYLDKKKYWSLQNIHKNEYKIIDNKKAIPEQVENLLVKILEKEIISDVPVGVYLSGGVDSTALATLLSKKMSIKINSFTIINKDNNFDESKIAKKTSRHLSSNHHEFEIEKKDLIDLIEQLSDVYTEPFADSSQLPTLLLNAKSKKFIKVAISGDGADELFGGYNRYFIFNKYSYLIDKVPLNMRNIISQFLLLFNASAVDFFFETISNISLGKLEYKNFGYKIQKTAFSIIQKSNPDLYDNLISSSPDSNRGFKNFDFDLAREKINLVQKKNFLESMMLTDLKYYLSDDILCKVDRASMWNGVEVRAPFLHNSLVEYCLKMPTSLMFKNNKNKWILRELIKKYIPHYNSEIKMGFSSPIDNWLKNEIKDVFVSCIDKKFINKQGIFDYNFVFNKWNEHLSGKRKWGKYLWSFLIFQKWFKKNC